jgi:hypothetical protein
MWLLEIDKKSAFTATPINAKDDPSDIMRWQVTSTDMPNWRCRVILFQELALLKVRDIHDENMEEVSLLARTEYALQSLKGIRFVDKG